jgi:Phosphotransferase enzyme family
MDLLLSSHNVIQYLQESGLCSTEDGADADSELPHSYNNRNFLVTLAGKNQLLVKQKSYLESDGIIHDFFNEWLLYQLLNNFPVLGNIPAIASSLVHFDEANSILVHSYLSEYEELGYLYQKNSYFPTAIATAIGSSLAALHRVTYNQREYRNFMSSAPGGGIRYQLHNPAQGIGIITPEIFAKVPKTALEFYSRNQRYENLEAAIADLAYEWNPNCLTHNDLQLENILIHSRWQQLDNPVVRFIDWEACTWGDAAFDLGTLIASYLRVWLNSLVVDSTLGLEESLNLAMIPVSCLQPSILALTRGYVDAFPQILEYHQDFVSRVVQFAGLALINHLEARIKYQKHFEISGISMLEVARNLIIMPQQSALTVFGVEESEVIPTLDKFEEDSETAPQQNLLRIYYEKTRLRGC